MTTPSIGRIVHYQSYGTPGGEYRGACRAAVITEVNPDSATGNIGLAVSNPTGVFFHSLAAGGCDHDDAESPEGGTWHWPERTIEEAAPLGVDELMEENQSLSSQLTQCETMLALVLTASGGTVLVSAELQQAFDPSGDISVAEQPEGHLLVSYEVEPA